MPEDYSQCVMERTGSQRPSTHHKGETIQPPTSPECVGISPTQEGSLQPVVCRANRHTRARVITLPLPKSEQKTIQRPLSAADSLAP